MGSTGEQEREVEALRAQVVRLEQDQAWTRTLLATVPAAVMRVSVDGVIEYINYVDPRYGVSPVGRRIYDYAPADQHEVMRAALGKAAQTLRPATYESFAQAPDGVREWFVTHVGPVLEGGRLAGLVLVSVNASQVKQAQAELLESRAKLKLALDAGNVGVWRWDRVTDSVEWDEKLTAMFGLTPGSAPLTSVGFMALVSDDQRLAMAAHVARAVETGHYPDFELRLDRPDGTRWVIIKGGVLRDAAGNVTGFLGGVVDVTERRRLDEHLRQAQKLEAVGQLSAGVAHNFNNMLAVILPALELARVNADPADAELMSDALASAGNAAQLVRQLMVFSRRGPRPFSLREPLAAVVRRAVDLCRQTFERRVALELGDVDAARFASVEGAQMEQAVMNLLLNARDAVGHDAQRPARIAVAARRLTEAEARRRHLDARGAFVELIVTDTGCGMDEDTRRRMLEPFFSTKPTGRGTGLGLSTVWATVQAHRGHLDCESEVGRGTAVSLLLPVQDEPVPSVTAEAPRRVETVGVGRVVLIIDDEPAVRRATVAVVRAAGFTALDAASGEEGVRLASTRPVDVVLLDYSMPGQSPQATLKALRQLQPNLPVVSLSGLGVTLEGVTAHLAKPVRPEELVKVLEAALSGRA
ncbi:MAG: response regulator [Myxococcales bacterium]|nr:response regulator [Myxococcales bacterium]